MAVSREFRLVVRLVDPTVQMSAAQRAALTEHLRADPKGPLKVEQSGTNSVVWTAEKTVV